MTHTITVPIAFTGTDAEQLANQRTHNWDTGAARCFDCDCRPWGRLASWPCGSDVPTEQLATERDYMTAGALAHYVAYGETS